MADTTSIPLQPNDDESVAQATRDSNTVPIEKKSKNSIMCVPRYACGKNSVNKANAAGEPPTPMPTRKRSTSNCHISCLVACKLSDMSKRTGILEEDIKWTMDKIKLLKISNGQPYICTDDKYLA